MNKSEIEHNFQFIGNGFNISWKEKLPYRVNKGDYIDMTLFDGCPENDRETPAWFKFKHKNNDMFEVEEICICNDKSISVQLGIMNGK